MDFGGANKGKFCLNLLNGPYRLQLFSKMFGMRTVISFMVLLLPDVSRAAAFTPQNCSMEHSKTLQLSEADFDQTTSHGWRRLAERNCKREAAMLIAQWRARHPGHSRMLYWHEGQLWADLGRYPAAIRLLKRARTPAELPDPFGWNFYVDGTIAFLRSDKPSLLNARERLARLERPADLPAYSTILGNKVPTPWPLNLNVLDGLISCWGKRYVEAYGCATAIFKYEAP